MGLLLHYYGVYFALCLSIQLVLGLLLRRVCCFYCCDITFDFIDTSAAWTGNKCVDQNLLEHSGAEACILSCRSMVTSKAESGRGSMRRKRKKEC